VDVVDEVEGRLSYRERVARIAAVSERPGGAAPVVRPPAGRAVRVVVRPPGPVPRTPLFDRLVLEGFPPEILAEAARRVRPEDLWKERYVRVVVRNLMG
jgi:uncharacterized protein YbjT (DUF2867 family)